MKVCSTIKGFCLTNTIASHVSAALGIGLFITTILSLLQYHTVLITWLVDSILFNGLILGAGLGLDVLLIAGLLCLGFSECSKQDNAYRESYKGGRTPVLSGEELVVLGRKPR